MTPENRHYRAICFFSEDYKSAIEWMDFAIDETATFGEDDRMFIIVNKFDRVNK